MDRSWWNAPPLLENAKDGGRPSMLESGLRREDSIETTLGTPASIRSGWSSPFAASSQADRSCGSESKLHSVREELPLQAGFSDTMRDWERACRERQAQQDEKEKLLQMSSQGRKAEHSCSRGGTDEFSEVLQEMESLKYHLHEVQAQLKRNDLRAVTETMQQDLYLTRFETAERSMSSSLRTFAHQVIEKRMDELEECMIDELHRGATGREHGEEPCAVWKSASMHRWSLPRWELAAAAKLKEESWFLKQEAEQAAKNAAEDRRRIHQWESEQREEARRMAQWESEQREEAQVFRQEEEQTRKELKAFSDMIKTEFAWRSEITEMVQELKREHHLSMPSYLEDRAQMCADREEQRRTSLQEVAHMQREVNGMRLEFEEELRSLRATHDEFRNTQLKLAQGMDSQRAVTLEKSSQRVEEVEKKRAADVRVAELLAESQNVQSELAMLLKQSDSFSKHWQEDHRISRPGTPEPSKHRMRSHSKLRDALTESQQLLRNNGARSRERWRP